MLVCGECGAGLSAGGRAERCDACGRDFPRTAGGVLDLFVSAPGLGEVESVTERVESFYEAQPFPDYREHDDVGALVRRGRQSGFTSALDRAVPPDGRVVEVGCGTGQLSMFFAATGREVVAMDLCAASLDVAAAFATANDVTGIELVRGNLFRPPVATGWADVVVANGVLHHTGDPRAGFASIVDLVRPGGHVLVGLYNRFGRALLPLRRVRDRRGATTSRGRAWWRDQHQHPHESRHSLDEVLGWLDENRLEFVRWIPPLPPSESVFQRESRGSRLGRLMLQLSWLPRASDGGLWITVARRVGRGPA